MTVEPARCPYHSANSREIATVPGSSGFREPSTTVIRCVRESATGSASAACSFHAECGPATAISSGAGADTAATRGSSRSRSTASWSSEPPSPAGSTTSWAVVRARSSAEVAAPVVESTVVKTPTIARIASTGPTSDAVRRREVRTDSAASRPATGSAQRSGSAITRSSGGR